MKNTTLCGKILHFVVNYSFCGTISHFCGTISHFCDTISHFVVLLWYICGIFVIYLWYFLLWVGRLEVGCVWGRGRWGDKKKKGWGVVCVWGGGKGGGRWGERREVGELCVCGRKGEVGWKKRGPSHDFISGGGGGGVQNILEKWGYLHGAWRSKLRVYYRGFGGTLSRENF